jgi:hypothetical protein
MGAGVSAGSEAALLDELRRKYVWWADEKTGRPSVDRVVAQVMDIGTYDDILLLEEVLGRPRLAGVMRGAAAGWFSARSWDFWRGRLAPEEAVPKAPPARPLFAGDS